MKSLNLNDGDKTLYQFSRSAVEAGDFRHFLEMFNLDQIPKGPALRPLFNSFGFAVNGYDDDPSELYEIPRVRAFFQEFRRAWPYWFFVADLALPSLQFMTFCCLPSLRLTKRKGVVLLSVAFEQGELAQFLLENFHGMNELFDRAGMTEWQNRIRSQQIADYYRRDWGCEQ
jgi:hypothetical protein